MGRSWQRRALRNAERIATPGSVELGSSVSVNGRWDDYKRITLPP